MSVESFVPRSSNLDECSYDPASQTLAIVFKSGDRYVYSAVPEQVWHGLKHAPSVGAYFYRQVRDVYPYVQE